MGKGDRRSRRGKLWRGSFGNTRPHKKVSSDTPESSTAKKKTTKTARKTKATK